MTDETLAEQRNLEAARISHANHRESATNEFNMVGSFSNAAMKAPAIAAAGGIAGLLGLYSANAQALRALPQASDIFTTALLLFFSVVLICVILPALAYLSQACFVWSSAKVSTHFDRPYVRQTTKSRRWRAAGGFFQLLAIVLTALSIGVLGLGGSYFLELAKLASAA